MAVPSVWGPTFFLEELLQKSQDELEPIRKPSIRANHWTALMTYITSSLNITTSQSGILEQKQDYEYESVGLLQITEYSSFITTWDQPCHQTGIAHLHDNGGLLHPARWKTMRKAPVPSPLDIIISPPTPRTMRCYFPEADGGDGSEQDNNQSYRSHLHAANRS